MNAQAIDSLARIASQTAMRAAADYISLNKVTVTDFVAATEVIREEVKQILDAALDEAKKAIEANMDRVAECSFRAAMAQAGISAGKRIQATCTVAV